MGRQIVYGPVPSRRLGLSLGIDLLPRKTCSYNCIYCQVGKTRNLQTAREEFFPLQQVLDDVDEALGSGPKPDVITLAGSGEPTLYSRLGELLLELGSRFGLPVVLITNGSLLWQDELREQAMAADIIVPSLDAGDAETFAEINRPHPELDFHEVVEGLRLLAKGHKSVRLEVMVVPGVNDQRESLEKISTIIKDWSLLSVDINTPVRPVPGGAARPCGAGCLDAARQILGPCAGVVASYHGRKAEGVLELQREKVFELLSRRPCTAEDLSASLGVGIKQVLKTLSDLQVDGKITSVDEPDGVFFFPKEKTAG